MAAVPIALLHVNASRARRAADQMQRVANAIKGQRRRARRPEDSRRFTAESADLRGSARPARSGSTPSIAPASNRQMQEITQFGIVGIRIADCAGAQIGVQLEA